MKPIPHGAFFSSRSSQSSDQRGPAISASGGDMLKAVIMGAKLSNM